jgi:hypothetical protein
MFNWFRQDNTCIKHLRNKGIYLIVQKNNWDGNIWCVQKRRNQTWQNNHGPLVTLWHVPPCIQLQISRVW